MVTISKILLWGEYFPRLVSRTTAKILLQIENEFYLLIVLNVTQHN